MTGPSARWQARDAACAALAALAYLGLAVAVLWPALQAPRERLPYLASLDDRPRDAFLDHRDQKMVVAVTARNAHLLTTQPWRLRGAGQCFPLPRAYTLGEHMFGLGLLAAMPWAATTDPIVSFNVAVLLTLWLAALSMYALSAHFTRSPHAAFVAGLLFMLAPGRISDPSHPYVHGDLWAPLALLFLHRSFTGARWRDVAGWVLFTGLCMLESPYPLIALALLLAVYVPFLLVRHRAGLRRSLPRLALGALALLALAWLVFGPYLETRATWGLLGGRVSPLPGLAVYLPGGPRYPGLVVTALAAIAALDRLRRRRAVAGEDPRLAYLAAALVIVWSTVHPGVIPGLGVRVPSPLEIARGVVPGLDGLRALPAVGLGVALPLAFLAGHGALVLLERRRRLVRAAAVTALAALAAAAAFHPTIARLLGGRPLAMTAYAARPSEAEIALVREHAEGALLDVPFSWQGTKRLAMADDLLRASFTPRPTAACYNSFVSPVQEQVGALAAALPEARAADALAALGFATVVLEVPQMFPPAVAPFDALPRSPEAVSRLHLLGATERLRLYRLSSPLPSSASLALLVPATGDGVLDLTPSSTGRVALRFALRNGGASTFRHPDPIAPSALHVVWRDDAGEAVQREVVRVLLPIALAPGARHEATIELVPPAPGTYDVRLELDGRTLAARTVRVGGPARRAERERGLVRAGSRARA
jgi:hypothetical protein